MKNSRNNFGKWISAGLLVTSSLLSASSHASEWQFEVTPYIWALNMNGHVGIGPVTTKVDESFGDIFKHLDFAAMVYGTAHKDQFGFYGNIVYASLSDSASFGPGSIIRTKAYNDYGIFGAGISYIVGQYQFANLSVIAFEPYAGARFTLNNTSLKINNFSTLHDNQHWTDPVLGANLEYKINPQWKIRLQGDVGGTSTNRQYSYSATGLIGYTPQSFWTNTSWLLGYHFLAQHYESGNGLRFYEWNMHLFGPVLALSIRF
jgi:hypothetical protein